MKKILVMLTVLALALAALPMTLAEEAASQPEENAVVWTLPETTEITPEQQAIFNKAMEGLVGVDYTPWPSWRNMRESSASSAARRWYIPTRSPITPWSMLRTPACRTSGTSGWMPMPCPRRNNSAAQGKR